MEIKPDPQPPTVAEALRDVRKAMRPVTDTVYVIWLNQHEFELWNKRGWVVTRPDGKMFADGPHVPPHEVRVLTSGR